MGLRGGAAQKTGGGGTELAQGWDSGACVEQGICEGLDSAERLLILPHFNPDPDRLGALVAHLQVFLP